MPGDNLIAAFRTERENGKNQYTILFDTFHYFAHRIIILAPEGMVWKRFPIEAAESRERFLRCAWISLFLRWLGVKKGESGTSLRSPYHNNK